MARKQVALIVLDGWGHREGGEHNAIAAAHTPYFDSLWNTYPHAVLDASGEEVGLPVGQIGNSEVGHMTIGAGKVIDTDLVRITKAMRAGEFKDNHAIQTLFRHVKKHGTQLHVMGLLSEGGVHSHVAHALGLIRTAYEAGITSIVVHAFTDGRDTAPQAACDALCQVEELLKELGVGVIATVSGRFYAMDRDNNWDRLARAEEAVFNCKGNVCTEKPSEYVKKLHGQGIVDEHIEPIVFLDEKGKGYPIEKGDGVIFFNFRPDRARMFSRKLAERIQELEGCFVTLTQYDPTIPSLVAFTPSLIETTLAAEVSRAGLTQVHIAETEKYAHATYFLNGGKEGTYPGEQHILIESRKDVPTHDLAPKMRAKEIADAAIAQIEKGTDFLFLNFANADMVGHTAQEAAIKEAVEEVDLQLSRVGDALIKRDGVMLVTSDHGNAEMNVDLETGKKHTAHTLFKVPVIVTEPGLVLREGAGLADVAPTVLRLMNLSVPQVMTGKSLF